MIFLMLFRCGSKIGRFYWWVKRIKNILNWLLVPFSKKRSDNLSIFVLYLGGDRNELFIDCELGVITMSFNAYFVWSCIEKLGFILICHYVLAFTACGNNINRHYLLGLCFFAWIIACNNIDLCKAYLFLFLGHCSNLHYFYQLISMFYSPLH